MPIILNIDKIAKKTKIQLRLLSCFSLSQKGTVTVQSQVPRKNWHSASSQKFFQNILVYMFWAS